MRNWLTFIAVAVAAPSIAAAAQQVEVQSVDGPQGEGEQGEAKQGRVCRILNKTGTRIRRPRVCMTPQEWDRSSHVSQDDMEDWKARPTPIDRSGIPR